jgi:transcriptional regulator with XRE-family HTH domain
MAIIEECPGFETFGADVKAARKAKRITQRALAETLHVAVKYLADIENVGKIPSGPVLIQLVRICGLPMERYFNPAVIQNESELRQRVSHKLKLCPEEYLTIVEGTIDGAISLNERSDTEFGFQMRH